MKRCPICSDAVAPRAENDAYPFCAPRCKQIDLGRWLGDAYVVSRPLVPDGIGAWLGRNVRETD